MYVKNYNNQDESDPNYKSADVLIAIKLKEENKAFKIEKYEHSYPHCWRTDKPILYVANVDEKNVHVTEEKLREMLGLDASKRVIPICAKIEEELGHGNFGIVYLVKE